MAEVDGSSYSDRHGQQTSGTNSNADHPQQTSVVDFIIISVVLYQQQSNSVVLEYTTHTCTRTRSLGRQRFLGTEETARGGLKCSLSNKNY